MPQHPPLNLIIPMAGQGKRFRAAGFDTFKPFIPVNGKPMIAYVTEAFPKQVKKHVITCREFLNEEQVVYLQDHLHCRIIDIPRHEHGPAFSIYQARKHLPLEEAFFISYCDIYWAWDFAEIQTHLNEDGAIYTHSGFHPHLIQNNFSAFCCPQANQPDYLSQIREKGSFTDDWMSEPLSIGNFYVKSGQDMMSALESMIKNNERVAGEFFPSLLFNHLIKKEKRVRLDQLNFYIHWGVPEQLWDFERWQAVISHDRQFQHQKNEKFPETLVCMAGLGKRMKQISEEPKALIPVNNRPLVDFVMDHFPCRSETIITLGSIARSLENKRQGCEWFLLENQTTSQFETLVASLDLLIHKKNFFLISCDAYGLFDMERFQSFLDEQKPDAVVFTSRPSLTHQKMAGHHSHVSVRDGRITAVHIKSKSSEADLGFAGFFWVRDGKIFDQMINVPAAEGQEMCVDHVFKYFVEDGLKIAGFTMDQYIHLGTPEELQEYNYWNERDHLFSEPREVAAG